MARRYLLYIGYLTGCMVACFNSPQSVLSPKPRAYPHVEFPVKQYLTYVPQDCPFELKYPEYTKIDQKNPVDTLTGVHCWFNIFYPQYNATLHCSYNSINSQDQLETMISDAFEIADQVNKRSNYTNETVLQLPNGSAALVFEFEGPAASPVHFFVTDSLKHFFKGALYYQTAHNPDSLGIITRFIREDIDQIMSTIRWK